VLQFGYAEGNHLNLPVPPNNYYYARQAIQIMNPAGKTVEDETDGEEVEVEE
jgi:hypothetical protein